MRKFSIRYSIVAVIAFALIGCQAAKEVHYFKEGDNYYRIRVNERAFMSSSRYVSGYFDESAVTNYFNEMHRPDTTARILPLNTITAGSSSSTDVKTTTDNLKLVMILSTNSDVVAEQIGNLADNEQTLDLLARMANKDAIKENSSLKATVQSIADKRTSIIGMGDAFISSLTDTADNATINNNLLAFLNYAATMYGKKTPFTTIDEAHIWYIDNLSKK